MKLTLTNVGHRRALFLRSTSGAGATTSPGDFLLRRILDSPEHWVVAQGTQEEIDLVAKGHAVTLPATTPTREIKRRLLRNPLEKVTALALEYTTECNFRCAHCYNANVPRVTETDFDAIATATDVFGDMGVRDFVFIGGEVSKYGTRWLDLASRLRYRGARIVGFLTNGWWLGARTFEAAGQRYGSTADYLADLREHGVTHTGFSIDGREAVHDRCRNVSGLYRRIVEGFATVRDSGITPRVSLLYRGGSPDETAHIAELARRLYPGAAGTREQLAASLLRDNTNIVSNFIDFGNGAGAGASGPWTLDYATNRRLRCAGFYRPAPQLTIKADGGISTCRLASAGDGYGNIHDGDIVGTLNRLQETFVCRLHAERLIGDYRACVDPRIFGDHFGSICTIRAIITMIARRMHDESIDFGDRDGIARINREVAAITGHLSPAVEKGSSGTT
jgi:pyruvate-formate lyase-activating enzyme